MNTFSVLASVPVVKRMAPAGRRFKSRRFLLTDDKGSRTISTPDSFAQFGQVPAGNYLLSVQDMDDADQPLGDPIEIPCVVGEQAPPPGEEYLASAGLTYRVA